MQIKYPAIGICGLSCRLCPSFHTEGQSKCGGCKSAYRMGAGCPFITCAIKKKDVEFCWECVESETCEKWQRHRAYGQEHDTFTSYQKLEDNINTIQSVGIASFAETQRIRAELLTEMLESFNEGRSKRYYCIAATVLEIAELETALTQAKMDPNRIDLKSASRILHSILDEIATSKHYSLKLRR